MDLLKTFDEKIAAAVEKVKALKDENGELKLKLREYETLLAIKDEELQKLSGEKTSIRDQIEELLEELDSIEIS
ncbi:MAG: cell division protein ZapB [Dissulfurispiraceae bacterium]|nr:cell division protein ZapB [Dissulfurispiraceae bacterium]